MVHNNLECTIRNLSISVNVYAAQGLKAKEPSCVEKFNFH